MASPTEKETPPASNFDDAYATGTAPWVIGEPQPAIVDLERQGWMRGTVLDVGCGTGEHTIYLARLGYEVEGIDASAQAVEQARANAAAHEVTAHFSVADALSLSPERAYDTILDSALFHIFGDEDRARYVASLHGVTAPGGLVHVLALSDTGPGFGPQVSESVIREAFGHREWELQELKPVQYRGRIVRAEHATALGRSPGELVDLPAWLARARRL